MNVHIPHFCCGIDYIKKKRDSTNTILLNCTLFTEVIFFTKYVYWFGHLVGKNIDASGSCHHVTMEVKIIVRTILSRAKNLWLKRHTKNYQKSTKIFSSQISKRAVITGVGGTLLFFDHFSCVIVE